MLSKDFEKSSLPLHFLKSGDKMNDKIEISNTGKVHDTNRLLLGIEMLIENSGRSVVVYLNLKYGNQLFVLINR